LNHALLNEMDAYWRAANYLSVGQIFLYDSPLLKRPLAPTDHFTEGEVAILTRSRRSCW
jgi:phosphoketolase